MFNYTAIYVPGQLFKLIKYLSNISFVGYMYIGKV